MIVETLKKTLFIGFIMASGIIYKDAGASEIVKVKPSWNEVHGIVSDICKEIDRDSFDVICGISVGGLIPTALFSVELEEKNVTTISSRSYQGQTQGELIIRNAPEKSTIEGKRVLLVDDIADSGKTIRKVKQLLFDYYNAASVQVAVIYVNTDHNTGGDTDFWGRETTEWVEFPWEVKYDQS